MAAAASCVDATNGLTVTPRVEGDYHTVLRAFDAVGASVTLAEWSVSIRVRPAFELAAEWAFRLEKLSQQGTTLAHDGEVSEKACWTCCGHRIGRATAIVTVHRVPKNLNRVIFFSSFVF